MHDSSYIAHLLFMAIRTEGVVSETTTTNI